jgi:hypothetical protein
MSWRNSGVCHDRRVLTAIRVLTAAAALVLALAGPWMAEGGGVLDGFVIGTFPAMRARAHHVSNMNRRTGSGSPQGSGNGRQATAGTPST